jgi:hypothetical protein
MRTDDQDVLDFLIHGLIGCPETTVDNFHSSLRNTAEERRSHLHRGESDTRHVSIWYVYGNRIKTSKQYLS